jgi:hypothetical protein
VNVTQDRDIPADPDEPETPIANEDRAEGHPDDTRDVGVNTDEDE